MEFGKYDLTTGCRSQLSNTMPFRIGNEVESNLHTKACYNE